MQLRLPQGDGIAGRLMGNGSRAVKARARTLDHAPVLDCGRGKRWRGVDWEEDISTMGTRTLVVRRRQTQRVKRHRNQGRRCDLTTGAVGGWPKHRRGNRGAEDDGRWIRLRLLDGTTGGNCRSLERAWELVQDITEGIRRMQPVSILVTVVCVQGTWSNSFNILRSELPRAARYGVRTAPDVLQHVCLAKGRRGRLVLGNACDPGFSKTSPHS